MIQLNSIVLTNLIISLRKTNDKKNKKKVNDKSVFHELFDDTKMEFALVNWACWIYSGTTWATLFWIQNPFAWFLINEQWDGSACFQTSTKNYKDLVHSSSKDGLLHCANLSKIINLLKAFYLLTLLIKIEIVNG